MGKTNDTAPAKAERKAKRYTVVQRGPVVFEVLDTETAVVSDATASMMPAALFEVKATHKTARLARAVARELNGEE